MGNTEIRSFSTKVWIAAAVTSLFVVLLLLLKNTVSVFMMILAGALIAIFFQGFAGLIERKLKLSIKWSMAVSIITTFLFPTLLFWLVGSKIQSQFQELESKFPSIARTGQKPA